MEKHLEKNLKKMMLVEVIPLARGIGMETLTYFTSEVVAPGCLIDTVVRNRKVKGLVVSCKDASSMKGSIKNAGFTLKKINAISSRHFLSADFIHAAILTAQHFASTSGATLTSLIPKSIIDTVDSFPIQESRIQKKVVKPEAELKPLIIQANFEKRIDAYIRIISAAFKKGTSVFLMVPSAEKALLMETELKGKIESSIIVLNNSLSKKNLIEHSQEFVKTTFPVLGIGTGNFLCLPRQDLSTVIIENESSRSYKMLMRPYIDLRTFAELFCTVSNIQLLLADELLRAETLERNNQKQIVSNSEMLEFPSVDHAQLVDMKIPKALKDHIPKDKRFNIFSDKLEHILNIAQEKNEKVFLFGSRKGFASTVVCKECGQNVLCKNCSASMVLYQSKNADMNFFLCHHCGEKRSAHETCKNCGSWKLQAFGIGTERIVEEIKKKFPKMKVLLLDRSTATTAKQARDITKNFEKAVDVSTGSVLVGTEMALSFLHTPVDYSAIISMDSLFVIPDFRINERVLHIILAVSNIGKKITLVQTRNADQEVIRFALHNKLKHFFEAELSERKRFGYPPFKQLIKVTIKGKKEFVTEQTEHLKIFFKDYRPFVFPALISTIKHEYIMHLILKIHPETWPEPELLQKLLSLSPKVSVQVDPESML